MARTRAFANSGNDRQRVTILISDGKANQYPLKEIDEARRLKTEMGSTVVALG